MSAGLIEYREVSPAEFFRLNRDLAGFTNPARSLYTAVREFVENSLDACELYHILPEIYVRISFAEERTRGVAIYKLKVEDNGPGVPPEKIPKCFGKILFGSKFSLRQARGKFGLGGTMAILYGQITTNRSARVISSRGEFGPGGDEIYEYELQIDIEKNRPKILRRVERENHEGWHGTVVEICLEGEYMKAAPKILEYMKQTAIANPHLTLVFVDPFGKLYMFRRVIDEVPKPPEEVKPHPYGVDVELVRRLAASTACRNMVDFMVEHFHRVGRAIAEKFLSFADIPPDRDPHELTDEELASLVMRMKEYGGFRRPDANCLSVLSEDMIKAGIRREFNPEFVEVETRKPSAYSGYPFIVQVALAYGGNIPRGKSLLFRFANQIPLLYDEASDVSWKVVHNVIDWKSYKVSLDEDPIAVFVYLFSTKIPYKTVAKEYIADRPEIEYEILNGLREVCRRLRTWLSKREKLEYMRKRFSLYMKYLPKIAEFSTDLAEAKEVPDVVRLLKKRGYGGEV